MPLSVAAAKVHIFVRRTTIEGKVGDFYDTKKCFLKAKNGTNSAKETLQND